MDHSFTIFMLGLIAVFILVRNLQIRASIEAERGEFDKIFSEQQTEIYFLREKVHDYASDYSLKEYFQKNPDVAQAIRDVHNWRQHRRNLEKALEHDKKHRETVSLSSKTHPKHNTNGKSSSEKKAR